MKLLLLHWQHLPQYDFLYFSINKLLSFIFLVPISTRVLTILLVQVNPHKHMADEMSASLSPIPVPAQKQLKYTAGIANGSVREPAAFMDQTRKVEFYSSDSVFAHSIRLFIVNECVLASADGTYGSVVNEEISTRRKWWETMEMEEESSSVAFTVQVEVAETVETFRTD